MVNATGERFVDEGADFRNYTYAKYGAAILEQPGQVAWQVFDGKVAPTAPDEYRIRQVTKVEADSLEDLGRARWRASTRRLPARGRGVQRRRADRRAVRPDGARRSPDRPASPCRRATGRSRSTRLPFMAVQVTCGIAFTFGGMRITPRRRGWSPREGKPIPGLLAAGEIVGGALLPQLPGGTGLTAGSCSAGSPGAAAAKVARPLTVDPKTRWDCTTAIDPATAVSVRRRSPT